MYNNARRKPILHSSQLLILIVIALIMIGICILVIWAIRLPEKPTDNTAADVPASTNESLQTATAQLEESKATATLEEMTVISYPYITNITEHSREIFRQGQTYGNRANVFSKVGDSITATEAFLEPIGTGDYQLHDHVALASMIGYFSTEYARGGQNSFANMTLAGGNGWLTQYVLTPGLAHPTICGNGEMPLLCEYRTVRPSTALIMLGTNDLPETSTSQYEASLRDIIERTLNLGIIPVISTIPTVHIAGLESRVTEFNQVINRLSEEYDIPLWDYGAVMSTLPNDGLSADGVHPSWGEPGNFSEAGLRYGMAVRNLTALQALDALYRQVILPETSSQ